MIQSQANHSHLKPDLVSNSPIGFFLLCIYTSLVFIRPHEWPVFETEIPILRSVLISAFVFYMFSLRPKAWNVQCGLLVLLMFSMLLSELRSGRIFSDLEYVQGWLISSVLPFVLYLGFLSSYNRQKWVLFISVAACMVMVHQANSQLNSSIGEGWAETLVYRTDGGREEKQVRYIGIFNDPNDMGMFLVMHIPIVVFFIVTAGKRIVKAFYLTILALLVTGIIWTGSRGSLIGLLAVLSSFFYIKYGKVKSMILGGLTVPLILIAAGFRSISKADESALHRLIAWNEGLNMWGHRPFVGFGKGRFLEYHGKTAHNSFVLIMGELGTFGYVLWVMFIYLIFYYARQVLKLDVSRAHDLAVMKKERVLAQYLMISLIGFCTTAFFISRSYILFFYVFAAMVAASYVRVSGVHPDLEKSLPQGVLLRAFIVSFASMFVLQFLIKFLLAA
jgi:O-antigen ligase